MERSLKSLYNKYLAVSEEFDNIDKRINDFILDIYEECKHKDINFRDMSNLINMINGNHEAFYVLSRASDMRKEEKQRVKYE